MDNLSQDLYENFSGKAFEHNKVALLCIDLQYYDTKPGYGFFKNIKKDDAKYARYFHRIENIVVPNVKRLQKIFREKKLEVIHVKIESLTQDGRDRSSSHKKIGCHVLKGSTEAKIVDEIEPINDEIVITKTASGVFTSTNIDYILRNMGITQLVVVGVLMNECIETAVRDGADIGYDMFVVKECVAALTEDINNTSLQVLDGVYAEVITMEDIERKFK